MIYETNDDVFQGKLTGSGIEEQLPTIAIVAHYDAYGVAPVSISICFPFTSFWFPFCKTTVSLAMPSSCFYSANRAKLG